MLNNNHGNFCVRSFPILRCCYRDPLGEGIDDGGSATALCSSGCGEDIAGTRTYYVLIKSQSYTIFDCST
ncbi:MAG: hypothetical protein VX830_04020 [Candidatus Poribacteria bacterium]|nr:hypothetical protein [Candidatus Poribacteria bacterium]